MSKSYVNEVQLRDGAVKIFQRQNAKRGYWHYRIYVRGMRDIDGNKVKYEERSTGETDLDEAKRIALDRYDELKIRTRNKQPVTSVTFGDVYTLWWAKREQELHAAWKAKGRSGVSQRVDWYLKQSKRYWIPYFGSFKMEEMTQAVVDGYWQWRLAYWSNAPQTERDRHRNFAETPSKKTLNMEQSSLREVFAWGNAHRLFNFQPIISNPYSRKGIPDGRRPSFDEKEWRDLNKYMDAWILGETEHDQLDGARHNSSHLYHRKLCRLYLQIIAYTGMRTGEVLLLKHGDIGRAWTDESEVLHYKIKVSPHTKTGARTVIGGEDFARAYMELRTLTGHTGDDDWLFCNPDGKQAKGFFKTLPQMLERAKLLKDKYGNRRSAYSCRHYYAESKLRELGVNPRAFDIIGTNMGTGRQSLENHYVRRGILGDEETLLGVTTEHKLLAKQLKEQSKQKA